MTLKKQEKDKGETNYQFQKKSIVFKKAQGLINFEESDIDLDEEVANFS